MPEQSARDSLLLSYKADVEETEKRIARLETLTGHTIDPSPEELEKLLQYEREHLRIARAQLDLVDKQSR